MSDLPPEVKVDLKEPIPNIYYSLQMLVVEQIEYNRLRINLVKIVLILLYIFLGLVILAIIAAILVPFFGLAILAAIMKALSTIRIY